MTYTRSHRLQIKYGFTIVELLIVIVVIAILAAITIVAFNGVQQRARASAASSAVAQTSKKLALYLVENGQYPADLASIGITNTADVTYQYTFSNAVEPRTFCVTATSGNVSYKSSGSAAPVSGGCAGHGQSGQAAITNLSTNPSFESAAASNTLGVVTRTNPTLGDAQSGTRVTRVVRNDTANSGVWWDAASPITGGTAYTVCAYLRGTDTSTRGMRIEWLNAAGSSILLVSTLQTIPGVTASWTRYCGTDTAPTGAGRLRLNFYAVGGTAGTYFDLDSVIITEGSTQYGFADGNSPDWVWNGTPNASPSTGPALP